MATCVADALTRRLKEYGLVTPFSTDAHGRFLSHLLSASHKQRVRREASAAPPPSAAPSDRLFFNISAFGKEFHLRLRPNDRLVAPGATVEWHDERGGASAPPLAERTGSRHGAGRISSLKTDCAFVGDIADVPGASVAMSNCDGLVSVPPGHLLRNRGLFSTSAFWRAIVLGRPFIPTFVTLEWPLIGRGAFQTTPSQHKTGVVFCAVGLAGPPRKTPQWYLREWITPMPGIPFRDAEARGRGVGGMFRVCPFGTEFGFTLATVRKQSLFFVGVCVRCCLK